MTLVRDALPDPTPLEVSVFASPVFEAIVAFWASAVEEKELDSFDNVSGIREAVESVDLGGDRPWMSEAHSQRWSFLVPHVVASGAETLEELAGHLADMDAAMLLRSLEVHVGDDCEEPCDKPHMVLGKPDEEQERLVGVLRKAHEGLGDRLAEFAPMLDHDAGLTRFLSRRMGVSQLIETVTNGISYRPEPGVRRIVLIPSYFIRPWNLMFGFGDGQYFLYPMSDEAASADRDTPPSWMVQMFKALGDERRLRLLRRLGEGPAGLAELADYLELAKSTTHHHLRTLRAAGLVRAVLEGQLKEEMHYELRQDMFPEAVSFVSRYLAGDQEGTIS